MKRRAVFPVTIGIARNRQPIQDSVKYLYRVMEPMTGTPEERIARAHADLWVMGMNQRILKERIPVFYI